MSYLGLILDAYGVGTGNQFTTRDLYSQFPLANKSSIRSALSRAAARGELDRIGRGIYKYIAKYVKVRIAKRVFDTHDPKPIRHLRDSKGKLELDIETTAEGWIPIHLLPKQAEDVVNREMLYQTIYMLNKEGFGLAEHLTEFTIEGLEKTDETSTRYNPRWDLEIKIVNKQGRHYAYNGWFNVPLKSYDHLKPDKDVPKRGAKK